MRTLTTTIACTLALLASTASAEELAPIPDAAIALAAIADGARTCAELKANYAEGNGVDGWLFLEIRGGAVTARRTRLGYDDVVERGALSRTECHALAVGAWEGRLWTVRKTRNHGEFGETAPRITLGVKEVGKFTVTNWVGDAEKTPAFAQAREHFLSIATRLGVPALRLRGRTAGSRSSE